MHYLNELNDKRAAGATHAADSSCHLRFSKVSTLGSHASYSSSSEKLSVWTTHSEPLWRETQGNPKHKVEGR